MLLKVSKKIVSSIVILITILLLILNIIYTSNIKNVTENVFIQKNLINNIFIIITIFVFLSILILLEYINKNKKINTKIVIPLILIIYFVINIVWIFINDVKIRADQDSVHQIAKNLVEGNIDNVKKDIYLERYNFQVGIVGFISFVYKIFGTTNYKIIQIINAFANVAILYGLYLIAKQINIKFSKSAYWILSATFIPLILLSTFVYGDYIGYAFAIYGIYFIIKYTKTNRMRYGLISAIFMAMAYAVKMNYAIFIIAILIYCILNILQKKCEKKYIIKQLFFIIIFFIISIIPYSCIQNKVIKDLGYDETKKMPITLHLYMGISESKRAAGWFNGDIQRTAWLGHTETAKKEYSEGIKNRIFYMIKDPIYTIKFYANKTISTWCDPTFQSIWYNVNLEDLNTKTNEIEKTAIFKVYQVYEKAIMCLIFIGTLIAVIKYRKEMTIEMMLILITFIGGVIFYTLWETKSRYVLPTFMLLMPIATIGIQEILEKLKGYNVKK